jgi:hypothetical protein
VLLGDADRERLFERLKEHAAAGRIGLEELERRVELIDAAETDEQAGEAMADLPPAAAGGAGDQAVGETPGGSRRPRWGRGHAEADRPAPDWRATNERFRDPKTNRVMRVWVDSGGGRHYVVDNGGSG